MVTKQKRTLLSTLLFLFFSPMIFAQAAETGAERFTLFWKSDEYAWNYEIVLEKLEPGGYTEILREKTEAAEVACSLTIGRYRYRVTAYDFFGQPGGVSAWSYFEIIPGLPETPGDTNRLVEEPAPVEEPEPEPEPEPLAEEPEPVIIVEEPEPEPPTEDQGSQVIPPKEPGDFFVEAAYSPLLSLPNTDFNKLYEGFLPVGFSARLGYTPFKIRMFSIGFELAPSWSYLTAEEDNYSVSAHLINLHLGFVGQLWLPNGTMALNLRLGTGLSLISDFHFEYSGQQNNDQITTWIPSMHGGISFLWVIREPFFVEIGAELLHIFSVDNTLLEFVRPSLGVGLRF